MQLRYRLARWQAGDVMRNISHFNYQLILAACILTCASSFPNASATELVGRVVDNVEARTFSDATVALRGHGLHAGELGASQLLADNVLANQIIPFDARTDRDGFFRMSDIQPGSYLVDITLADGRAFMSRLIISSKRNTQFLELDYSRAVPPDDHDDY